MEWWEGWIAEALKTLITLEVTSAVSEVSAESAVQGAPSGGGEVKR